MLSLGNELLRSIEFSGTQQGAGSKASTASQGLQRNDVVLSMALAHCGFADQLLVNQEVRRVPCKVAQRSQVAACVAWGSHEDLQVPDAELNMMLIVCW